MIHLLDIFDDIHESLAVQQYGQEVVAKARLEGLREGELKGLRKGKQEGLRKGKLKGKLEGKLEGAVAMLAIGIPIEQVASVLNLSVQAITKAQRDAS